MTAGREKLTGQAKAKKPNAGDRDVQAGAAGGGWLTPAAEIDARSSLATRRSRDVLVAPPVVCSDLGDH